MKICVVGAGAIGGLLGVRFALAGHEVTLVARGANLQAIARDGMRLRTAAGEELHARWARAAGSIGEVGEPQDLVILAMKAHQVEAVARDVPRLFHAETVVIPMQNGIPWWYFQRLPAELAGRFDDRRVAAVDPSGAIAEAIDPARIVGCVVYPAAELEAPGRVRHVEGDRFPLGEPDGAETARVRALSEAFAGAGLKAPVLTDIRSEIWLKLWGNLSFNPISALTHATLVDICRFPISRELAASMMQEAQSVAERLGARFRVPLEKRIAGAEKVGKHKTSMLQDVEAGRDPEIDALVGAVIELGELVGVPTPHIATVYALMKLLGRTLREERVYIRAQSAAA
ncbi:MAG: 2-dehydropantoate 2-reductase [Betaproteobacteria bacterium]|nr:2-dehydropantoate 2-reductase [Betaproteobacteria bacterium]